MPLDTTCPGRHSRRSFMKIGSLSLGALSGGASLRLSDLLAAQAAAPTVDKDFSVILLWAGGGTSHLETFDMKPDAPSEYRGEFMPTQTKVPGMQITELLPRLASRADKFTLVRSLFHNRNEHSGGTARLLSGYPSIANDPIQSEFPFVSFQWLHEGFTVLPIQMFNWVSRPQHEFQVIAAAAGLVLVVMTLSLNAAAIWLRYRMRKRIKW